MDKSLNGYQENFINKLVRCLFNVVNTSYFFLFPAHNESLQYGNELVLGRMLIN